MAVGLIIGTNIFFPGMRWTDEDGIKENDVWMETAHIFARM